jgi:uncharacterized membrane protein
VVTLAVVPLHQINVELIFGVVVHSVEISGHDGCRFISQAVLFSNLEYHVIMFEKKFILEVKIKRFIFIKSINAFFSDSIN